jgi:hypothetical protein
MSMTENAFDLLKGPVELCLLETLHNGAMYTRHWLSVLRNKGNTRNHAEVPCSLLSHKVKSEVEEFLT